MDTQSISTAIQDAIKAAFPVDANNPTNGSHAYHAHTKVLQNKGSSKDIPCLVHIFRDKCPEDAEDMGKFNVWLKKHYPTEEEIEAIREQYPEQKTSTAKFKREEPEPPGMDDVKEYLSKHPDPKVRGYLIEDMRKYPLPEVQRMWKLLVDYVATQDERAAKAKEIRKQYQ